MEAELIAATSCFQEMMFITNLLESIKLQVELPMLLEGDNKGVVDLVNNWRIGGRTRHIGVRINFLKELKETGIVKGKWIPTEENCADIFTKNLSGATFEKHVGRMCKDEDSNLIQWEGVEDEYDSSGAANDEKIKESRIKRE